MATFGGRPLIDHDNLEEYADPVDYDRQDTSDTGVAFYAALAQETGGPVLEIACSRGRVAIPIARRGFAVTGLDVVPGMLRRAQLRPRRGAVSADLLDRQRLPGLLDERRAGGAARARAHPPPRRGVVRLRNAQPALAHPRGAGRGPRRPVRRP